MSKQQTAVEWLVEKIENNVHHTIKIPNEYFEQAKEMEREQMKEMYLKGIANYDPTFKIKESNGGDK
jgi:hypothetical protein